MGRIPRVRSNYTFRVIFHDLSVITLRFVVMNCAKTTELLNFERVLRRRCNVNFFILQKPELFYPAFHCFVMEHKDLIWESSSVRLTAQCTEPRPGWWDLFGSQGPLLTLIFFKTLVGTGHVCAWVGLVYCQSGATVTCQYSRRFLTKYRTSNASSSKHFQKTTKIF